MPIIQYKIRYTYSARNDVSEIRRYIISHFKYYQLVDNFKKKMQRIEKGLKTFPDGYEPTGFMYRGYAIFIKPENTYLIFYTVDKSDGVVYILRVLQDGMDWKFIINKWIKENS